MICRHKHGKEGIEEVSETSYRSGKARISDPPPLCPDPGRVQPIYSNLKADVAQP